MGMLRILSSHGDNQYSWDTSPLRHDDPEAEAAVREAERIFAEYRARGASAFRMSPHHAPSRLDEFDPAAESIIIVPRIVGG